MRHCVGGTIIRKVASVAALVLVATAAYLCLWPIPAEPVSWPAQKPQGYTGAFAPNTRLSGLRMIDTGSEIGPEHIAIGPDGKLYAAMHSGNLIRMEPDGGKQEVFANTGGRVLGFDFDAQGRMIAADAMKGLLAITADRSVSVLADRVSPDDPIRYADAVVVAPDGRSISPTRRRALLPRNGAARTRRACSTSSSKPPPAVCSPMTRQRGERASWPVASLSPTASPCLPTATPCL